MNPRKVLNSPASENQGIKEIQPKEDIFGYIKRNTNGFDQTLYQRIIGNANEFKEGDQILGVAAPSNESRLRARQLLANTLVSDIQKHPLFNDSLYSCLLEHLSINSSQKSASMTMGQLKEFLLTKEETEIHPLLDGLSSDVIGCMVKIMSNEELIKIGQKIFNPLAGTKIGSKGYMGARVQPNSPTDNPEDIIWQVFSAFSFAVGDVVLGVNPASSLPECVSAVENALMDVEKTFKIENILPHCVLAHIDVQAKVEKQHPGTTGVWFQSLAGSDKANATFDVTLQKMLDYATQRTGKYGFYFETGQGADCTNGHGQGTDMVIHESRKYGFVRLLKAKVAEAQKKAGNPEEPWVHVNDVAGFIGPEVFRTRDQLVRCCLEDIVMGKLHGLTIGLDVCSTLHMDISLDDLDWCMDQIMPANPAYCMSLPTKNDPMLGYLTTAFQDHVRVREKFGYQVNDEMWKFYQKLNVIDEKGNPTSNFGQPLWIWLQFRHAKGDKRPDNEILDEGRKKMQEVRARGVCLAEGFGDKPWKMEPGLDREIRTLYEDSKKCIWAEFNPEFIASLPNAISLKSCSKDRADYILHPESGERIDADSLAILDKLKDERAKQDKNVQVQIVLSDGLNAHAIMDKNHLAPYLTALKEKLEKKGLKLAVEILVVKGGRVRAGYRIGEKLFGEAADPKSLKAIVHIIGERPGTTHHTFSAYITAPSGETWSQPGKVDHNITKVVSGIADTALEPFIAAEQTSKILEEFWGGKTTIEKKIP
ncbi:MAG: ethanolamine ammonia-lyase subunit EutB [Candidatus Riflebacteria bacterium]|nr:ethanolamine ammonia-lyase subunit EutB [Candidatus Riflebacteria bacterium]